MTQFGGRILVVGLGAVSRCTLPLNSGYRCREIFPSSDLTIYPKPLAVFLR